MRRRWQRYPARNTGQRSVRLTDGQEVFVGEPGSSEDLDFNPLAGVVRIVNLDQLDELFLGSMSLLRPEPGRRTSRPRSVWRV